MAESLYPVRCIVGLIPKEVMNFHEVSWRNMKEIFIYNCLIIHVYLFKNKCSMYYQKVTYD